MFGVHLLFVFLAIALISKYVTKGWKEVQIAYADKENVEEVVKVLSYLEVVEKVKHSCDETEVINLIEEHKLEREQLLTDHLKSKQVGRWVLFIYLFIFFNVFFFFFLISSCYTPIISGDRSGVTAPAAYWELYWCFHPCGTGCFQPIFSLRNLIGKQILLY